MYGVTLADQWFIPLHPFPAEWLNLEAPGAVIRPRNGRPINVIAGMQRNTKVAEFLAANDGLAVVFHNGKSSGTKQFLKECERLNVPLHKVII
jgi:hypothetical protein